MPKIKATVPETFTPEEKAQALPAIKEFMELTAGAIREYGGKPELENVTGGYALGWHPVPNSNFNAATVGMMLQIELYDHMPKNEVVVNAILARATFNGSPVIPVF